MRALGSSSSSSWSIAVTKPKSPTFTTSSMVKKMLEGCRISSYRLHHAHHTKNDDSRVVYKALLHMLPIKQTQ